MSRIVRYWQGISVVLIVIATAAAYWPALRSCFVTDDFFLLVIARHTGDPLSLFLHSHFPGSFFYRPMGMTLWWLSAALFDNAPKPHYVLNLCLHAGVACALWRLLVVWTQARVPALLCALAFALHPIAIGTSLWLADRFDLLSALFALLAMTAAWNFAGHGRRGSLVATLAFAALAALAKEIGFSVFVPIVLIWAWPLAASTPVFWSRQRRAAGLAVVFALLLLAWRHWLIGDVGTRAVLGDTPLSQEILDGFRKWGVNLVVYTTEIARSRITFMIEAAAGLLFLALLGIGLARAGARRHERIALFAATGLVLATILLQAPVLRTLPPSFDVPADAQVIATGARMFYLSLLGLIAFIGVLWGIAARTFAASRWARSLTIAAAVSCFLPWAVDAHGLARAYRRESLPATQLAQTTLAAVTRIPAIGERCQVHFLGVEKALSPAQELAFSMQIDAAIKALASPAQAYLQTCRFQTDRTPWFYVLKRGSLTADAAAPMQPVYIDGKLVPWLEYGGVEIAYLNLQKGVDPKSMTSAHFLEYRDGAYADVTTAVLAGEREVTFRCGRRASQCALPEARLAK